MKEERRTESRCRSRRRARSPPACPAGRSDGDGVIKVRGIDDLLVYRAKCCNPIRGENIVGYVTRGKGVAVHSKMCPNVQNLMYDVERKIEVEWARAAEDAFPVRIVIHTDDRPGMLNQLTSVLSNENTNIRSLEAKTETRPRRRRRGDDRGRARQEAAREAGLRHAPHLRRPRRGTPLQLKMPFSTDPEHIAISKSKGIKIDWKDGHHSEYGLTYLRDKCPCATCTGAHGTPPRQPEAAAIPFQMFKPALKMLGVEPVGQLRHPHQLERRPQRRHLLLRALPPDLPVRRVQEVRPE